MIFTTLSLDIIKAQYEAQLDFYETLSSYRLFTEFKSFYLNTKCDQTVTV